MKNLSILLASMFLFWVNSLSAQDFAKKGIWEIGGRINYSTVTSVSNGETSENSLNTFTLNVPVYYFVINGLEVGLIPGYEYASIGDNSASLISILAGIAYNIRTRSAVYPYAEGRFGWNSSSNGDTESGILWLLGLGIKVQVGNNALVTIGLSYEQRTLQPSGAEGGRDGTNTFGVDAGFAVFFDN